MTHSSPPTDPIETGCPTIDDALNGGFPRGEVSHVYGEGGSGKTNLAAATAVHTVAQGGAVFFYVTEESPLDRIETLATAHPDTDPATAFDQIFLQSLDNFTDQHDELTTVTIADDVGDIADLLIVDSLSGFYRLERGTRDEDKHQQLEDQLTDQLIHLLSVARRKDIAVLVTNQVYYHPDIGRNRPLGGTLLRNWCKVVGRLEEFSNNRHALTIEKHSHPTVSDGETAIFAIKEEGLVVPS